MNWTVRPVRGMCRELLGARERLTPFPDSHPYCSPPADSALCLHPVNVLATQFTTPKCHAYCPLADDIPCLNTTREPYDCSKARLLTAPALACGPRAPSLLHESRPYCPLRYRGLRHRGVDRLAGQAAPITVLRVEAAHVISGPRMSDQLCPTPRPATVRCRGVFGARIAYYCRRTR
jgi:hypothetical protein